jgi:uncharacterized protein YbaP (TraB family)
MKRLLARCAIALLLLPAPAIADPALWVVKDADTTIYLFGTVHLMPKDADWRYPALEHALADSQTLYIELTDDNPANIAGLVLRLGMDTAHPLASQLDASEAQRLRILADEAGVPGGMRTLNVMRPWLAALTLSLMPLKNAGLNPEQGVDKQLKAQMLAAHKPVIGLETAEQQIRLLADMPRAVELGLLRSSMREADQGTAKLQQMIAAWKAGDPDTIDRVSTAEMRAKEPKLYQSMLVQRNEAWAKKIATLLQQPGTIFMAVGAAHLAGPDSVQVQLRKLAIPSQRK